MLSVSNITSPPFSLENFHNFRIGNKRATKIYVIGHDCLVEFGSWAVNLVEVQFLLHQYILSLQFIFRLELGCVEWLDSKQIKKDYADGRESRPNNLLRFTPIRSIV